MFFCTSISLFRYVIIFTAISLVMPLLATGAEVTSLKESISYAIDHNRMLAVSASRVERAEAGVDMATGRMLPRVDISSGFSRTNSPLGSFGSKLQQQRITTADFSPAVLNQPGYVNNYQSRLGLTMPLFSGSDWASRASARESADASALEFEFHKQQLIYQTIAAYAHARQALAQVGARKHAVKAAEKRWQDAQALQKRGMAIKSDVMDAHVHVLRSRVALGEAESAYAATLESLRLILGMNEGSVLNAFDEPKLNFSAEPVEQMLEHYEIRRSDLRALQNRLEASSYDYRQSQAAYLPRVDLMAAQEWNNEKFGLRNRNTMVGINVTMNLFSGGEDLARVRAATEGRVTLELQVADKRQQIANEIRQASRSLNMAEQRYQSESEAFKQTTESLRIKSLRHAQGLEKTSDLLDAQVKADASEMAYIRAKYDLIVAKAALLLAAGTLDQGVVQ